MRSTFILAAGVLALTAMPGRAADDIIKGVYLKSEKLCAQAKKTSLQAVIEAGNLVLTNRGIDATEFNCAFVQVLKHPRLDNAWIATAFCEEPEFASPDLFTIMEREPGKLQIASLAEGNVEATPEDGGSAMGEDPAGDGENTAGAGGTGENGGAVVPMPNPPGTEPETEIVDEGSYATTGGTYVRCDGVTMP